MKKLLIILFFSVFNNALFAQPQFRANLDPRSMNPDVNGQLWGQSGPMSMQASPLAPVSFSEMGGSMPTKFQEPTTLTTVPPLSLVYSFLSVTLTANSPCSKSPDKGTAEAVELFLVMIVVIIFS